MALQGTIETFALPDVMRLLASTSKTGCLRLTGSRGEGRIFIEEGAIVAGDATGAPHAGGPVEVVFELLRFPDGDFVFDTETDTDATGPGSEVEATLAEAEAMLDEWRSIESVVPSLESWITLSDELPEDEVSLDRERWTLVVAVAGGTTVGQLGEILELGELPVSRAVKGLIELGLAAVGEAPVGAAARPAPAPVVQPAPEPVAEPEPAPSALAGSDGDGFERFDPSGLVVEPDRFDVDELAEADVDVPPAPEPVAAVAPESVSDPSDAAEIARQLANLSPKAAKAVAAAAKATTQEERERALAEVDDEEDPINRDLLIKFLGSVNG